MVYRRAGRAVVISSAMVDGCPINRPPCSVLETPVSGTDLGEAIVAAARASQQLEVPASAEVERAWISHVLATAGIVSWDAAPLDSAYADIERNDNGWKIHAYGYRSRANRQERPASRRQVSSSRSRLPSDALAVELGTCVRDGLDKVERGIADGASTSTET
jgi:hypothetical protein